MRKLTKNEQRIVDYLADHRFRPEGAWTSPTMIGEIVGGRTLPGYSDRLRHSSWASPICLRLVRFGFLERNEKGHYRILRQAGGK